MSGNLVIARIYWSSFGVWKYYDSIRQEHVRLQKYTDELQLPTLEENTWQATGGRPYHNMPEPAMI